MVSYQIFTQTALTTVASAFSVSSPAFASALNTGSSLVVFVCSFAWIFVLSAVVSKLMFGRERRLSIQFLVSLVLTLTGSTLLGLLFEAGVDLANPSVLAQPLTALFGNAVFAFFYLALPFIFMVAIDLRSVMKRKK
jgi:hypothetical protein